MTQHAYDAMPAFFRGFPKDVLERQYAKNAQGLRTMLARAERTGRKVGGFTAEELRAMAEKFEALSRAS